MTGDLLGLELDEVVLGDWGVDRDALSAGPLIGALERARRPISWAERRRVQAEYQAERDADGEKQRQVRMMGEAISAAKRAVVSAREREGRRARLDHLRDRILSGDWSCRSEYWRLLESR